MRRLTWIIPLGLVALAVVIWVNWGGSTRVAETFRANQGGRELDNEAFAYWLEHRQLPIGAPVIQPRETGDIWEAVHKMSHHVSKARNQWGFEPLTEERVNWLIVEVYHHTMISGFRDELLDIFVRWKAGDFSKADMDHNAVWRRLNGNIGWSHAPNPDGVPAWAHENQKSGVDVGFILEGQ